MFRSPPTCFTFQFCLPQLKIPIPGSHRRKPLPYFLFSTEVLSCRFPPSVLTSTPASALFRYTVGGCHTQPGMNSQPSLLSRVFDDGYRLSNRRGRSVSDSHVYDCRYTSGSWWHASASPRSNEFDHQIHFFLYVTPGYIFGVCDSHLCTLRLYSTRCFIWSFRSKVLLDMSR